MCVIFVCFFFVFGAFCFLLVALATRLAFRMFGKYFGDPDYAITRECERVGETIRDREIGER